MKIIFDENKMFDDGWRVREFTPESRRMPAGSYDSFTVPERVIDKCYPVHLHVIARWDRKTGVLYVERSAWAVDDTIDPPAWMPTQTPVFAVTRYHNEAVRQAVAIADGWYCEVAVSIPEPDTRSDEQVKADYYAAEQPEEQAA